MTTYVHKTTHDATGRLRPSSWHIAALHTRAINGWKSYCGRYFETTDVMEELPAAKSCESCLRIQRRRQDHEDDGSTQPVEIVP